jgi:extradiol dioxygenase family protein
MDRHKGGIEEILQHLNTGTVSAIAIPVDDALELTLDEWQSLAIVLGQNGVVLTISPRPKVRGNGHPKPYSNKPW